MKWSICKSDSEFPKLVKILRSNHWMPSIWTETCDRLANSLCWPIITDFGNNYSKTTSYCIIYCSWISPPNTVCVLVASLQWWMEKVVCSKAKPAGFWKRVPSKIICNRGRDGMKLNTAVKLFRSKQLTSNKPEKQRQTARLPDDLPTSTAKMSQCYSKTPGGCVHERNHRSQFICVYVGRLCVCVSVCVSMFVCMNVDSSVFM